ncbi:glycosyltransferase family 2 protein [Actinoallomurus rhizosphaericola]|uniref:glycosyltransferase family 2 protein n=1 Tax=Actinoallomurus rhizosphaericola TaxID=2952536 RepID=UPI00209330C1|nr:glycosyltransferase family 2 protein [Actinoallomurus rhizosphaericola]
MPQPVSDRRIALARLSIMLTVTAWLAYLITWLFRDFFNPRYSTAIARSESVLYLLIVTMLTVSALAYLMARLGFLYRTRTHYRASRAILDQSYATATPTLTTIIPSYQEESRVIRTTLLSAALQEYPDKSVVLLIDDPYVPKTAKAREQLIDARKLPGEINRLLSGPANRFAAALAAFERAAEHGEVGAGAAITLAEHYDAAANWLENLAAGQEIVDHTDAFFVNEVVLRLLESFREVAMALRASAAEQAVLDRAHIRRLYRRLVWTFQVEVTSFERKRYVSLSHEPNKAMNLNSYIGLMGGTYREVQTVTGLALARTSADTGQLVIPNPDYVVTLDADSVLLPEYCLRLVHLLEQNEYRDMAIAQTPYSAFPGSATRLERIAGATTDLQHIVHQGLTYYDATFWVGANAVIRKRALDDIAETSYIGDWEIRHYIKDRTVIEDTESTIDMGVHGWRLLNYNERLSYSATPPDFGSLSIQRQRWANGGLLIIPKLFRKSRARRAEGKRTRFSELFLRWNYMASISWSSASLLVLLAFPFNATLISPMLGLVALPYFWAMASDLRYCGYKRLDVLRIYGFNLVLLPVNLAGTLSSIVQGITASKAAFARTPKVRNRTVAPPTFVIAPYLLVGLAGYTFYSAYRHHLVENMVYAGLNIILACYAIVAFIGLRNSVVDAWIHGTGLLYKPGQRRRRFHRTRRDTQPATQWTDWRTVLDVGYTGAAARPAPAVNAAVGVPAAAGTPGDPGVPGGALVPVPSGPPLPDGPPRRRLSLLRVAVALALTAGCGYGGYVGVQARLERSTTVPGQTWFAPYVDVTLTPTYQFQNAMADPARQTVLSFVVSDPADPCTPSWGAAYRLEQADQSLNIGSRIAQVQKNGAQPIVSFGGQAHTSLDAGCTDVTRLTRAYQQVIDRYHLTTIDLDIEGTALDDLRAQQRRTAAMVALERAANAAHRRLGVWLTVPVEPSGLQGNAISAISAMLRDRVSVAGINVMTMDFAQSPTSGGSLLPQVQAALNAIHGQLADLLPRYGVNLTSSQVWARIGATVMIGQNDVQGQRFTVADAQGLTSFASSTGLGRISMWSLNRDGQCGSAFAQSGVHSNTCSGTAQSSLGFSQVFGQLQGQAPTSGGPSGDVQAVVPDKNPAHAPYPQWSPTAAYPIGYKVVEDGQIYQAKWYNTGQDPAAQVQYSWQSPWELLGPVLPGYRAPRIARPKTGTYPAWSAHTQYKAGARVIYKKLPYQAKWANQGVTPGGPAGLNPDSPWKPLFKVPGEPTG